MHTEGGEMNKADGSLQNAMPSPGIVTVKITMTAITKRVFMCPSVARVSDHIFISAAITGRL